MSTEIELLFKTFCQEAIQRIEQLPQSGSDRMYFRIYTDQRNFIATYNENIKENDTFFYFTNHFLQQGLPVPKVYAINDAKTIYIQEDLGTQSLMNFLETEGHSEHVYTLFQKSLQQLAAIQIKGHAGLDYDRCLTAKEFGKQAILSDLLYFKYYFLDTLKLPYDKQALIDDFEDLSIYLSRTAYKCFMFRDFQSRNIIVNNDEVFFIDYQGGMHGALQYDVASLLWQAKAALPDDWKNSLLDFYIAEVEKQMSTSIDKDIFINQYNGYVLIRLLQVLGAYGFRGLFERKAHFLSSIPLALSNLKWFVENKKTGIILPEFDRILHLIMEDKITSRFSAIKATEKSPLTITIHSFSYRNGYPIDETENGGGFVFDCRGILNPGRIEQYKKLSGLDKSVQDFLEQETKMNSFLNSVFDIVDISVENYLSRDFESLQINFGCTGGQHRSVYAAEQTARHLRNKYNVKVILEHTNKCNWVK